MPCSATNTSRYSPQRGCAELHTTGVAESPKAVGREHEAGPETLRSQSTRGGKYPGAAPAQVSALLFAAALTLPEIRACEVSASPPPPCLLDSVPVPSRWRQFLRCRSLSIQSPVPASPVKIRR